MNTSSTPALLLAAFAAGATAAPLRVPTVVEVPDVYDAVVDRFDILYASSASGVRRFDLRTGTELAPLQTPGADVRTLALDPAGCRLAIGDVAGVNQGVWVLERLDASLPRKLLFPMTTFYGGFGSYSVIWENPDHLLSTSIYPGSGNGPVRRTNVATGAVEEVLVARQDSMLAVSADGRRWTMVEAGTGAGPVHLRDVPSRVGLDRVDAGLSAYEVAISKDGDIVTVPTYAGALVYDVVDERLVRRAAPIGVYSDFGPVGMVFSPHTTASFAAVGGWDPPDRGVFLFRDYSFLAPVKLDPAQFTWGIRSLEFGRVRVSADGRRLLVTQPHSVLVYDVAEWGADPAAVFSDGAECSALR